VIKRGKSIFISLNFFSILPGYKSYMKNPVRNLKQWWRGEGLHAELHLPLIPLLIFLAVLLFFIFSS
jgi:hypothetical protein